MTAFGLGRNIAAWRLQQSPVDLTQQCESLPGLVTPDATSSIALNPFAESPQSMDLEDDMNDGFIYQGGESPFTKYLENPHSREELKRVIQVALSKWSDSPPRGAMGTPPPPPPSDVPPVFLPIALARHVEWFIHFTMAGTCAPPECLYPMASMVASNGPSASSELQGDGKDLDPRFLEELDTDYIFDVIEELADE